MPFLLCGNETIMIAKKGETIDRTVYFILDLLLLGLVLDIRLHGCLVKL